MKTFLLTTIAVLTFGFNASDAAVYSLSGSMDPAQALSNPADTGSGSGTIVGDYDDASRLLNYTWGVQNHRFMAFAVPSLIKERRMISIASTGACRQAPVVS
jgi:hypothetical protein